jgi:hypothetical protein
MKMTNVLRFRPRTVWLSAGVTAVIVIALIVETVATRGLKGDLIAIAWGSFVLIADYLLFIHPTVTIFDEGITITNPLQKITVGWHRVESIDARYTMSITVGSKVIYAWAAPAPGRYHSRSIHHTEVKGMDIGFNGEIRPGESPRSDSGQASYIAKLRLKNFEELGLTGCESEFTTNYTGAIALIASLAIALIFYALSF